ncbi:MAG: cobalamin B12-binding domain-containing protein [Proteobacteria bacterium]|nr:cobalamin B12-binding domain-containing protein [Pseudomonadota bacterium]
MRDEVTGHPVRIGLAQINNSFSGQNYLPYAVGLLQSYVEQQAADPQRYQFLLPVYKRIPVDEAVAALADADVVGFSLYVWNLRISLEVARRLKARRPDILVVFGGPQVPDRSEDFLRENPFIDVAVNGPGERGFLELVEALPGREWSAIRGISYIDAAGGFVSHAKGDRREMSEVPSPYLTGVFEPLMAARSDESWIALWETNRGCPFSCTFCDWGSATAAKVLSFEIDRLYGEIKWFAERRIEFLFCCDANFGILARDVEITRAVAAAKIEYGYPKAFSVQNTKNATERAYQTQKILAEAGLSKGTVLSMQSVNEGTLESIKRDNISLGSYEELQRRFTRDRIETYSDLIIALPGETFDTFADGVSRLIENGQHNRIQFNNLSILPNAEMGDPAYQEKYGMVTVRTRVHNVHGSLEVDADGIYETQDLVIATHAMPLADWRRARTYGWMSALLHFDKLMQIPFIVAHEISGISYRQMIEAFMNEAADDYPLLRGIRDLMLEAAAAIQGGGSEYIYSQDWLNMFWPADEYVFIKLTAEGSLDQFYSEAGGLLRRLVGERGATLPLELIDQAIRLNQSLIKRPFSRDDATVKLDYDIWKFYQDRLIGRDASLERKPIAYQIDRTSQHWTDFGTWCREVVWWGSRKGAYLYGNRPVHAEIAGHH